MTGQEKSLPKGHIGNLGDHLLAGLASFADAIKNDDLGRFRRTEFLADGTRVVHEPKEKTVKKEKTGKRLCANVLITCRDKILLIRKVDKNVYELPGGKQEGSESLVQCACREVQEEVGISFSVDRLRLMTHWDGSSLYYAGTFKAEVPDTSGVGSNREPHKIRQVRWVSVFDLECYPLCDSAGHAIKAWLGEVISKMRVL